ncbi:Ig-like domain-containing protein [Myxococcus sp. RHSTA-1-4]|uniref:Ig-like domain-containing protein n=1 Tax=Myxococcus sp. RHSTA-1-4 TaxID=2874601 RepID=UPI001CBF4B66|nr:Ig-like domain-containing protein [Myxococcus sp. RHSTA-1-4]MBZ4417707.1 Ig-like domain-containing protein [Myxococcus sp. RHSTA-1-4]
MDPFEGWNLEEGAAQLPQPLAPPMPEPQPRDDASESFDALDAEAAQLAPESRVDSPVVNCPLTWLEVTLFDEDGDPIADEPFEASLPDGSSHKGRTDPQGRAKIHDVDVEAGDVDVEVSIRRAEDGSAAGYLVRILPRASPAPKKDAEEESPSEEDELRAELTVPDR